MIFFYQITCLCLLRYSCLFYGLRFRKYFSTKLSNFSSRNRSFSSEIAMSLFFSLCISLYFQNNIHFQKLQECDIVKSFFSKLLLNKSNKMLEFYAQNSPETRNFRERLPSNFDPQYSPMAQTFYYSPNHRPKPNQGLQSQSHSNNISENF